MNKKTELGFSLCVYIVFEFEKISYVKQDIWQLKHQQIKYQSNSSVWPNTNSNNTRRRNNWTTTDNKQVDSSKLAHNRSVDDYSLLQLQWLLRRRTQRDDVRVHDFRVHDDPSLSESIAVMWNKNWRSAPQNRLHQVPHLSWTNPN